MSDESNRMPVKHGSVIASAVFSVV